MRTAIVRSFVATMTGSLIAELRDLLWSVSPHILFSVLQGLKAVVNCSGLFGESLLRDNGSAKNKKEEKEDKNNSKSK